MSAVSNTSFTDTSLSSLGLYLDEILLKNAFFIEDIADRIEIIWKRVVQCFTCSYPVDRAAPVIPSIERMQMTYGGLKEEKWREGIDGQHQKQGKWVYDRGLHKGGKGPKEPGYLQGVEAAFSFVAQTLGQPTTSDLYLRIHKVACAHFKGAENGTLMGQEKVGVFRDVDDKIYWNYLCGVHRMRADARRRFNQLDLGTITPCADYKESGAVNMAYKPRDQKEIRSILDGYVREYDQEIARAHTRREKLTAIAKFTQQGSWLHPVRDGSGRTGLLILNKQLVENGFTPVILEHPYKLDVLPLAGCVDYLEQGMKRWEKERNKLEHLSH